ncbi:dihydroorotase [Kordiimonas sp. SCSIO 12610]|uniref:dihydroorotase n=1 Tax=Kordiimonas sp. SCSIO 12610 TaxID=2829597 RepID=UPI00210C852A|nr:dihydroorotase [Kordiimonas sp. SCSIO 12610]UTW54468.1 dihydroorotase [Kordiimonas sp. SCSIO 12610]
MAPGINNQTPTELIITRPDDWHAHLRDGDMLKSVANYTARQFARAIIMPNLAPPVTTTALANEYRERIIAAVSPEHNFTPLMTCYLTNTTDGEDLRKGFESGVLTACKLYPANATTNSSFGVTDIENIFSVLEVMQEIGMPLLVHGEVTDKEIDIFDREAVFIERVMSKVVKAFPELKVVFEHITTANAADFVMESTGPIGATITPQHLEFNRNAIFDGGIRPHYYCLPIAKREEHRLALRKAATSGSEKFFLGTDTAPHTVDAKESACGCAGIFNAPYAIENYASVFEEENALDKLEAFASLNGPKFYGLPVNKEKIVLKREETLVPERLDAAGKDIMPYRAGETLRWKFKGLA